MSEASTRVWLLLATLSCGDAAWCLARGIGVANWLPFAEVSIGLLVIALIGCRRSGLALRVARVAEWSLLWLIFSVAGALLTYLAAARGGPLYDPLLADADAALGFDWAAWHDFVVAHPVLHVPFAMAYRSLLAQIVLSVLWFAKVGREYRGAELLTNVTLALLLTAAMFCLFPSFGPCAGNPAFHDAYVEDLVGLRSGTLPSLDIMLLKGVVAFPSFHAVLAILFTYAYRGSALFLPVAVFNTVMLASLPSEGGHYLVDVFGGVSVGVVTLVATRVVPARIPALAQPSSA